MVTGSTRLAAFRMRDQLKWADRQTPNAINSLCVDPAPFLSLHHPLFSSSPSATVLAPPSNKDLGLFKTDMG